MNYLILILSYLLGSISAGYFLFWAVEKKDIRNFGSGNPGATNVFRLKGWRLGLPVLVFDVGKGWAAVFLARHILGDFRWGLAAGALAVLGHCFPFYLKFKGGKGIATSLGVFAAVSFLPFLGSLTVFLLVAALSRYVSLGSLVAVASFGAFVWFYRPDSDIIIFWLFVLMLVCLRHKDNLGRLLQGKERKLGEKK
ncbi:MAG: acyl-phosphate glycerol 3-phosphate acyltransferase [Candidatus Aminicenantes bacterium]|nr:MAG: acyl-phosphate glycerol 3-phosphate acyltransferase [Candidatus Aminicenantes bacterium]